MSMGFELSPHLVDLVFALFDRAGDGRLAHEEFIAVLRNRLRRQIRFVNNFCFLILWGYNGCCIYYSGRA